MPWQLETPSVPKSYGKGGRSESVSYLPGAWQTSTPDLQQLGQLFCSVYPPCLCGNMGGFKGRDRRQQMPSGRDGVLKFERMRKGQVRKEPVLFLGSSEHGAQSVCDSPGASRVAQVAPAAEVQLHPCTRLRVSERSFWAQLCPHPLSHAGLPYPYPA